MCNFRNYFYPPRCLKIFQKVSKWASEASYVYFQTTEYKCFGKLSKSSYGSPILPWRLPRRLPLVGVPKWSKCFFDPRFNRLPELLRDISGLKETKNELKSKSKIERYLLKLRFSIFKSANSFKIKSLSESLNRFKSSKFLNWFLSVIFDFSSDSCNFIQN